VPPELALLCAGLKLVQHIGGSKSSGAGAVSVEILKITTGGGDVSLATALAPVGEAGWPDGVGGAS
jgi:hypothetical protein